MHRRNWLESLEPRLVLSAIDGVAPTMAGVDVAARVGLFAPMTSPAADIQVNGAVENIYTLGSGATAHTDLAEWRVYDDVNANAVREPGEPSAFTRLDGTYSLSLAAGPHTLRLDFKSGWVVPPGEASAATVSISSLPVQAPVLYATMANPSVIDLMVLYTPAAAGGQSDAQMATRIASILNQANGVYANSNTNVLLNVVYTGLETYTETGSFSRDLSRLQAAGDGYMDDVPALRNTLHADLVSLLVGGHFAPGDTIGLAYIYQANQDNQDWGYSMVGLQGAGDWQTLAHEIGHNLGAGHDVASGGSGVTAYAHGYVFTGNDGVRYKDVMAYGTAQTLPFFSTPDVSYAGHPIGDAVTADNARAVRMTGPSVAAYRAGSPVGGFAAIAISSVAPRSTSLVIGRRSRVAAQVVNAGTMDIAGPINVSFYLSSDVTLGPDDRLLVTAKMGQRLSVGRGRRIARGFEVASDLPDGPCYVLVNAQATGTGAAVTGTAASDAVSVEAPFIDLSMAGVATLRQSYRAGARHVGVHFNITNLGNVNIGGRTTVDLYLSSDSVLDDGDWLARTVGAGLFIKPGAKRGYARNINLSGVAPGSYWLIATVNADATVSETSPTNNSSVSYTPFAVV